LLLVAAGNDRVRVFETDTGYELLSFPVYELAAAQFAPDGKHILTVANDQLVALWDIGLADRAVHMSGHQGVVNDASFSRDGRKVVSASKDGTARIWDAATGRLQSSLAVARASVDSAVFDAGATRVLTVSGDGKARLWEVASGVELQSFDIGDRWRVSAALSPDGRRVVTGSSESVKLWDAATGNVIAELGRRDLITEHEVLFSSDGSAILTTTDTGETCLWNGTTGQSLRECLPPRQPEGKLALASFSADGKLLLVPSDTSVGVFDSRTGSAISKIEVGDHVRQSIFDPAGTKVLVVTANVAQLWEARGSSRVAALQGHESLIMQARFDPSGRTILTASHDRSVRLWDAADGRQLAILRGRRGRIGWTISYEPRGERVLVLSEDNTVSSLWIGSDPGTVIRRAGDKLPARMTADEERRFYITTGDQSPGSAK
jgi:WD40 repeat protein